MKSRNFARIAIWWFVFFSPTMCADLSHQLHRNEKASYISFFDRHIDFIKQHGEGVIFCFMYVGFSNALVEECRVRLEGQRSLAPLVTLWLTHKKDLVVDDVGLRELSILIVMIYESLFLGLKKPISLSRISRDLPWFSLVTLYFRLSTIPLAKLFDIIDECLERYKSIFEDYSTDFNQNIISWMVENWWLSAMVGVMAVVSFARWYRDHKARKRSVDGVIFLA